MNRLLLLALCSIGLTACASFNTGKTAREDGRFTIGAGAKRLMYGYPVPYSTSHFVVAVDGHYASNSPAFGSDVGYLNGDLITWGGEGSPAKEITFGFREVRITQRLIPVDRTFNDVQPGGWGQYYRVEYELENRSPDPARVGLMLLIDTMIDDNDASQMDADDTRVTRETQFAGARVPSQVLVYRKPGDRSDLHGVLVTDKGKAVRPDELVLGRWPYFHSLTWTVTPASVDYTDSAILLRWAEQTLAPGTTRYVATHYGLPWEGELAAVTNAGGFQRDSTVVYFDFAKATLTDAAKASLERLVQGRSVAGAFVEVYTDAVGTTANNLALAKKRAEAVTSFLREKSIPAQIIIPKSYGEAYADQSAAKQTGGKQEDRRAVIVVFERSEEY